MALLELLEDPGLMVNALLHARTVVGGDAVLTRISLQGQYTGGAVVTTDLLRTGTPAISLEATRRLKETIGRRGVLACQVTGPLALARTQRGPEEVDDFGGGIAEAARQAVL